MPRMHGERAEDYGRRRLFEAERKEVTQQYLARPRQEVLIDQPCRCNAIAYCWRPPRSNMPHYHSKGDHIEQR
jgi:hypothetical protein